MKKIILMFMCFSIFLLCGCGKNDELGKNSIVSAIYADYSDGGYVFYAKATDFSQKEQKDSMYSAFEKTANEAWLSLNKEFSSTPYFGHLNAIVLGNGFFKKNTEEILKFFLSLNSFSPNAQVYITRLGPYEIDFQALVEMASNRILPAVSLYTFFLPSNCCCDIPILEESQKIPFSKSTAVIKDFSYVETLEGDNFLVYSLLKNRNYTKYYKTFEIISSASHIKAENSKLKINLKISSKSAVPLAEDRLKALIESDIKNFVVYLKKNKMTYILKNEEFNDYELKTDILAKETSKIR